MCGFVGRRGRSALALAVAAWVACSPAVALSAVKPPPGLHVDPGSPAGKQYQIPIPSARHEAAGSKSSSTNPPLFGVGIHPSTSKGSSSRVPAQGGASRSSATGAGQRARGAHHRRAAAAGSASPGGPRSTAGSPLSASSTDQAAGSNGWLPLLAGGALVLVLGGGGGLALRRRHPRHRSRGTASGPA